MEDKQPVSNPNLDTQEMARIIIDIMSDMKGEDILLMDLRDITIITDFFIICTTNNERQLKAMVEKILETLKKDYGVPRPRAEGVAEGGWILV
ncbi:MAG: ribosome silencing factor, partial [Chloroflexi bacterium]|nr:ribosome silencing factor [Chloroflexota bacterium]